MKLGSETQGADRLPVEAILPQLLEALSDGNRAILCAPPGAGKTTLVPLRLLDTAWREDRRLILLEPRRLAARAAAQRMADLLGEPVGQTVGYRMRLDSKISNKTRIEVVTEGVFTRMILDDPSLDGIGAVIFDEFHERSLEADFGLALALDVQEALRDDLRIIVMSATLDVEKTQHVLAGAPVIESRGRSFPVDIRYEDRPPGERIEESVTRSVVKAHAEESGSILAFLPGQGEIRRVYERLEGHFGTGTFVVPLFGNLSKKEQDQAITPPAAGTRKIVLATSIAETSITIDGVRIVIDSGFQRLPVFEPATGMTRLETVRVSRAAADQRAGRAGRTEPGIAIRLWNAGQTAALPAHTPPQILASDLTGFVLDLAAWGVSDPAMLHFADQPPKAALQEARQLLISLGALDDSYGLTTKGKQMRALGLPPRLAAMVVAAGERGEARQAALLAVLLGEQGLGGSGLDLDTRLAGFQRDRSQRADAARGLARKIASSVKGQSDRDAAVHAGALLIDAYPDRIAFQRGGRGRFLMANGRGGEIPPEEALAGSELIVVADATGKAGKTRILSAAAISRQDIEDRLPGAIITGEQSYFDRQSRQVRARRSTRLGAIIFEETPLPAPTGDAAAKALAEGLRALGLDAIDFGKEALQLRERIGFLHRSLGSPWPDVSDNALLEGLDDWFVPFQSGVRSLDKVTPASLKQGLHALVPFDLQRDLNVLAPTHFETPAGQRHPIQYEGEEPLLSVRVQELFGLKAHPSIAGGRWPLLLELTSPAHRPIQTTRDLPGFWAGSWKDVRAEMRGRYPKHPWPEDPAEAEATHRAKPRGR
ncbi:ATP-dependent helicase HrpB [Rhizobium sp. L1K21]|uniref:ATP-dependent helicase HrpB n=1 Tax=Rhizobium sp. L1K21 TaxID=2954933 RepID=UPI002093503D|nr:ATP-dependent helicase HrpB [Rhizobium sp. L1K21]MCO6187936.1 ATP-dependent helicase HrpB [Rhizobium sp. L1K21]